MITYDTKKLFDNFNKLQQALEDLTKRMDRLERKLDKDQKDQWEYISTISKQFDVLAKKS